jgi:hypothetical protein
MLAHNVFFSLVDHSVEKRQQLLQACQAYLAGHDGIVFFACGVRADELRREVNDLNFDVALHIVFVDQASHDSYQTTPAHLKFIEENKANWRQVRVFDSMVTRSPTPQK